MNRLFFTTIAIVITHNLMAQKKIIQTAGRDQLVRLPPNLRNSMTKFYSVKCGVGMTCSICATGVW